MKGQSAVEYILLFLVSLIIFIPILIQSSDIFIDKKANVAVAQSQSAVNSITDAVDFLCIQSRNSKITVPVYIPTEYVKGEILSNTVQFIVNVDNSNITLYSNTKCTINGSLPGFSGRYNIEVKNTGDNVTISVQGNV